MARATVDLAPPGWARRAVRRFLRHRQRHVACSRPPRRAPPLRLARQADRPRGAQFLGSHGRERRDRARRPARRSAPRARPAPRGGARAPRPPWAHGGEALHSRSLLAGSRRERRASRPLEAPRLLAEAHARSTRPKEAGARRPLSLDPRRGAPGDRHRGAPLRAGARLAERRLPRLGPPPRGPRRGERAPPRKVHAARSPHGPQGPGSTTRSGT
jgi:hypothetical protein